MKLKFSLYEFLGTLILVSVYVMVIHNGLNHLGIASLFIAIAVLYYLLIFLKKPLLNPALDLAFLTTEKINSAVFGGYFLFQILAALTMGFILRECFSLRGSPQDFFIPRVLLSEFLGTIILSLLFLDVHKRFKNNWNVYPSLMIAGSLALMLYLFKDFSIGLFNPALVVSLCVTEFIRWADLWIFIFPQFAGAAVASWIFNGIFNPEAKKHI